MRAEKLCVICKVALQRRVNSLLLFQVVRLVPKERGGSEARQAKSLGTIQLGKEMERLPLRPWRFATVHCPEQATMLKG
jgi:hypothetical protein